MPCVFEMDGALGAEEERPLQAGHGSAGVGGASEVDEGHRARAAAVAAGQESQARETGATAEYFFKFVF